MLQRLLILLLRFAGSAWVVAGSTAPPPLPPSLDELAAEWQDYHRGLGHPSDPPSWKAPKHGLALPTANSELGSAIADENVLAVRDLTLPPYTQGPWSSVARNASRLGRLSVGGAPLYTARSRWTPVGFEREAEAAGRRVSSIVRLPLSENGAILQLEISAASSAGTGTGSEKQEAQELLLLEVELLPEIRSFPAAAMNCSEHQWRYPSNMQRNCWNWYAPRSFLNETADFTGALSSDGTTVTFHDAASDAVTVIAMAHTLAPHSVKPGYASWRLPAATAATLSFGVAFGDKGDEDALARRAKSYIAPGSGSSGSGLGNLTAGMEKAAADRAVRFAAVFDPKDDRRYSGSLPLLQTEDEDLRRVYYAGVVSMLELERTTATLPFAPPNTSRAFVTGAGSNASTNIFFWDTAYCVTALTLLDPEMIKSSLLHWCAQKKLCLCVCVFHGCYALPLFLSKPRSFCQDRLGSNTMKSNEEE